MHIDFQVMPTPQPAGHSQRVVLMQTNKNVEEDGKAAMFECLII